MMNSAAPRKIATGAPASVMSTGMKPTRDRAIPPADYAAVAEELERLEEERLRELGYQGGAKRPWRQAIRKGTQLGRDPYGDD